MLLHGSLFQHAFDNRPTTIDATWGEMIDLWRDLAAVERARNEKDGIRDDQGNVTVYPSCPAVCPAQYPEGSLRRKHLVERWYWFAADIDNEEGAPYLSIDDAVALMHDLGIGYCIHSTTKSRADRHRFRLMFPLSRPIEAGEFADVWASVSEMVGEGRVFDIKTRDPSRLFFAPAAWEGADNRIAAADGPGLDIDWVRATFPVPPQERVQEPPPAATPEMIREAAKRRAEVLGDLSWAEIIDPTRSPFVTDKMREEYHTAEPGGRFYRFLTNAALRALNKGYPIQEFELQELGLNMDRMVTNKRRENLGHEVRNALSFAVKTVGSPPSFEERAAFHARRLRRS